MSRLIALAVIETLALVLAASDARAGEPPPSATDVRAGEPPPSATSVRADEPPPSGTSVRAGEPPPSGTSAPGADPSAPDPAAGAASTVDHGAAPSNDIGDQGVGATIGIAAGGRVTPGGLRVTGHYLYQLSETDWFDGIASFTFGSGEPACFRDRMDAVICEHGLADGGAIELAAGVRRVFAPRGRYRPFVRAALGLAYVRFGDDDVSGLAVPLHASGGLRARVSPAIALVALADVMLGIGRFGRGLGAEPQLGLAITAGAEFRLR